MAVDLIINVILALLLAVAIVGGLMLNQRLQIIRKGQEELASLVQQLNEATGRAQSSVHELKQAGSAIEENLRAEIGKARALADELALITEAGDNLADRLEKGLTGSAAELRQAQSQARSQAQPQAGDGGSDLTGDEPSESEVDDEAEFLDALKEAR